MVYVLPKYIFQILTLILIVTSCSEKEIQLSENAKIAKNYLEHSNYEVISYQGDSSLEFSRADLRIIHNQEIWSIQHIEPDEYLNKRIDTIKFTIKNHPLDDDFNAGETTVSIWLLDRKVIGGWSYPISKNDDIVGSLYSLSGETSEEIRGDDVTWLEEWTNKYGELKHH